MTKIKRRICVLGSTGTIGSYTLDLVRAYPDQFEVVSLAAGRNIKKIQDQIREFCPRTVSVLEEKDAYFLKKEFPGLDVSFGQQGLENCIDAPEVSVVIVGIVGFSGLEPTLYAIRKNKLIGLANKESLVTAGALFQEEIKKNKAVVVPVDSEHNALYQLLNGVDADEVETVVLTASGGPFLRKTELNLEEVTPEMAVAHPNWKMGPKISVDSATLMNKGLELIEAHFLFGFLENQIEVWVHPQSIVHGAIWLKDHTSLAQLSLPDMKSAIGYALSYPERLVHPIRKMAFSDMVKMEFFEPDQKRFPCLNLARQALRLGQSHIIGLNATNELAVDAFLKGKIKFTQIPNLIELFLNQYSGSKISSLADVFHCDLETRVKAQELIEKAYR